MSGNSIHLDGAKVNQASIGMGVEIVTCWRTIDPTLAAVMRVTAYLHWICALSPPNVGQSAEAAAGAAAAPRPAAGAGARCWVKASEAERNRTEPRREGVKSFRIVP